MSQANSRRRFLKSGAALSSTGFVASLEALQMRQAPPRRPARRPRWPVPMVRWSWRTTTATGLPLIELPAVSTTRASAGPAT